MAIVPDKGKNIVDAATEEKDFNRRYYLRNGIVSVAIFLCTLMSVLWELK